MSSITAPMPRAAFRVPARWYAVALPILATVAAEALATYAWLTGNQPIRSDALGYYELGLRIAQEGPLAFESTFRTYGYPAFLAVLIRLLGPNPEQVRTAGFVIQLTLFVAAAGVGALRLSRALGKPGWAPWIYAVTVFSPFVLIHAIQMLTDVLSVSLVYLAVVLSLPGAPTGSDAARSESTRRTVLLGMLVMLLAGLAVIVRPANLVLLPVLLLAWLYRTARSRDLPWRAWPLLLAMLVLPFVPQMVFNARAYGVPHPLLTADLYASNTVVGVQVAKYSTLNIAGVPSRLHYFNPFRPTEELSTAEFLRRDPLNFGATLALHAFALFDHDFPYAYINDVNPWYRWPLAIPNYLFVLGGFAGLLIGLRWPPGADAATRARSRFTIVLLGAATGALVTIYLPSAIESRFSLPMYPLLAAPFLLALERAGTTLPGRPALLALVALGAAAWVATMAGLSIWLQEQAPLLQRARAELATALPPSPRAAYQVNLPEDWEPGQLVTVPITVTNTGPDTWNVDGFFTVAIRAQIVAIKTDQHKLLPKGARVYVNPPGPVPPGESIDLEATVETPTATGRYVMTVAVIRTGIEETEPGFEKPIRVDKGR